MKVTVFAKKKTSREGKPFTVYVGRLTRKDGSTQSVQVKFREECGQPKPETCPCIIEFDKKDANLSDRVYVREDTGEEAISYTLWISSWKKSMEEYIDHSMDDFE